MQGNGSDQNTKIVVGVCGLGQPKPDLIDCLVKLLISGYVEGYISTNATLLPYARNNVVKRTYELFPDFTHILMIDDDMNRFEPNAVIKLYAANKPIISGICLKRGLPYQVVHTFDGQTPERIKADFELGDPQPVIFCGTAFTLIKREVFEALQEETEKGPLWFNTDREERTDFKEKAEEWVKNTVATKDKLMEAIIMGQQSHLNTKLVGEDARFCITAKQHGYQSWVHYGVPVGHIGEVTFDIRSPIDECTNSERVVGQYDPVSK